MSSSTVLCMDHDHEIHKDYFVVHWKLKSNFFKSVQGKGQNPELSMEIDDFVRYVDKIIDQSRNKKTIVFAFNGNEVTLYDNLYLLLKTLKEKGCKTAIQTSIIRPCSYWERFKDVLDFITLNYQASGRETRTFFDTLDFLHQNFNTCINIQIGINNLEATRDFLDEVIKNYDNIALTLQYLRESSLFSDEKLSTLDELEIKVKDYCNQHDVTKNWYRGLMRDYRIDGKVNMSPSQYVIEGRNQWKGWVCWAGVEQILVNHDGHVYRGHCMLNWIGKIDEEIVLPILPVVCENDCCRSYPDILTKKQCQIIVNPQDIRVLVEKKAFCN